MTRPTLAALVAAACVVLGGRAYARLSWAEIAGLALIAGAWAAVWELRRRPLVEL